MSLYVLDKFREGFFLQNLTAIGCEEATAFRSKNNGNGVNLDIRYGRSL